MASFAKIGLNGKVIEVLSVNNEILKDADGIEQENIGIDFLTKLTGWAIWKQTSYNTKLGQHYLADNTSLSNTQEKAFRKNHAGIGYTYDEDRDAFIPPKPFKSWILNENTYTWESPIPMPNDSSIDKKYQWNEQNQSWDIIEL